MADFPSALSFFTDNAVATALKDTYDGFTERREALGLSNPGTVENVGKEIQKDVLLSGLMFSGLRADLTKVFGVSPIFRISHAFTMGSGGNLPPYAFSSMFGTPNVSIRRSQCSLLPVSNLGMRSLHWSRYSCKGILEATALSRR